MEGGHLWEKWVGWYLGKGPLEGGEDVGGGGKRYRL